MTTRAVGPGAGWSWLKRAVNLGSKNPKNIFGAAALLLAVALVPTIVQLVVQHGLKVTDMQTMWGVMGFSALYSMLIMPPLIGSFLRIIHLNETGVPVRAMTLFDVYKPGGGAGRIIGLMILLMVVAIVLFGGIVFAFGGNFIAELATAMSAAQSAAPGAKPVLPMLPQGFGTMVALLFLGSVFFNGLYALSMGQVVLNERPVVGAFGDGVVGTLKNLLPLLVLLVVLIVAGIAAGLILLLVIGLLASIGGLVHPVLAAVLAAPLYLGAMLALYVVMLGVMYFMWRDICSNEDASIARTDQLEL